MSNGTLWGNPGFPHFNEALTFQGHEPSSVLLKSAPWCLERSLVLDLSSLGQMLSTAPVIYASLRAPAKHGWGGFSCLLGLGLGLLLQGKARGQLLVLSLQLLEWMACTLCFTVYPLQITSFDPLRKDFALAIFTQRTTVLTFPLWNRMCLGCLGGTIVGCPTLDLDSGHDLGVVGSSPG